MKNNQILFKKFSEELSHYSSGIDIDYHMDNDCSESGCDDEGICRCGVISESWVEKIDSFKLAEQFCQPHIDPILFYCVDRVINRTLNKGSFEIKTSGGYYGEEIDGVTLTDYAQADLKTMLERLLNCSASERVKFVLNLEYGRLLPEIEAVKSWWMESVKVDKVVFQEDHLKHVDQETVKNYALTIDREHRYHESTFKVVCGIGLPRPNQTFRLIDGYHRYMASKKLKLDTVSLIVGK